MTSDLLYKISKFYDILDWCLERPPGILDIGHCRKATSFPPAHSGPSLCLFIYVTFDYWAIAIRRNNFEKIHIGVLL